MFDLPFGLLWFVFCVHCGFDVSGDLIMRIIWCELWFRYSCLIVLFMLLVLFVFVILIACWICYVCDWLLEWLLWVLVVCYFDVALVFMLVTFIVSWGWVFGGFVVVVGGVCFWLGLFALGFVYVLFVWLLMLN